MDRMKMRHHGLNRKDWRTCIALLPLAAAGLVIALTLVGVTGQRAFRIEPARQASESLSQILPQGWAFFIKAPQTPRYRLFSYENGALVDEIARYSVDHASLYGWYRSYRNFAAERELVEHTLAGKKLTECTSGLIIERFSALGIGTPEHSIAIFARTPILCGPFFVSVGEPVPWAWTHLVEGEVRVTEVTTIEISC